MLRDLTKDPHASWKSPLQWQAIQEVCKMSQDMLLVMATGGGKTMVAIIPTLLDGNVSVIVLPLTSLITDYKRKFNSMKIKYDHYTTSTKALQQDVHFIFISADVAKYTSWTQCLTDLNDHHRVTRLFFDEAHLPLLGQDFRTALTHLYALRVLPMQFVLLTGTAPPSSEQALLKIFGLPSTNTLILRGPTNRPELCYDRLLDLPDDPVEAYAKAFIHMKQLLKSHNNIKTAEDRVLIYVPYISLGEKIARDLDCDFYSGKIQEQEKRVNMYLSWYLGNGKSDILVATSALSLGNDHPSVRLVIHFGTPADMMSYVQEISRAGRNGNPAKCILIPIGKRSVRASQDEDHCGIQVMHNLLWTKIICIRYAITLYSDGKGVYCSGDDQPCYLCIAKRSKHIQAAVEEELVEKPPAGSHADSRKRKSSKDTSAFESQFSAAKKSRTDRSLGKLKYIEDFQSFLALFQSACSYCTAFENPSQHHRLFDCPILQPILTEYRTWKGNIRYGPKYPHKSCWFCHIPLLDELHIEFGSPELCKYPDIVAPVAFAIFQRQQCRVEAERHFKIQWPSITIFTKWLISPPFENELTNISALFCWYCRYICSHNI
jgi:hypothetical protein